MWSGPSPRIPSRRTKVAALGLELPDALPELLGLAGVAALLGDLGLERGVVLLDMDEVEDDVEHAREDQREEERRAGEVH